MTGILNKRSGDSSLEKINDAILSQNLSGRMLNFGDLEILTAAEMANDQYHMLNRPKEFKKMMLTQKHTLETEFHVRTAPHRALRGDDRPRHAPHAPAQLRHAPPAPLRHRLRRRSPRRPCR